MHRRRFCRGCLLFSESSGGTHFSNLRISPFHEIVSKLLLDQLATVPRVPFLSATDLHLIMISKHQPSAFCRICSFSGSSFSTYFVRLNLLGKKPYPILIRCYVVFEYVTHYCLRMDIFCFLLLMKNYLVICLRSHKYACIYKPHFVRIRYHCNKRSNGLHYRTKSVKTRYILFFENRTFRIINNTF
uniref:Zf-AD domain-containing protein n=2 Tax=Heterorhabditis bacteriophora TaxID=37862 RepID=A0A1I7WG39_HETBA